MGESEKKCHILVVDDELDLCEILKFNIEKAGFEVSTACSAEEAMSMMGLEYRENDTLVSVDSCEMPFHLLLLDVMMDGMSGFEFAKLLKKNELFASIPIIFLTAKDKESDLLEGFALGADDYIAKPFSVREVVARIRAVLNRSGQQVKSANVLEYGGLCVDMEKKAVSIDGVPVSFTKTEFDLLSLLLTRRGYVFSRQELIATVWPEKVIVTNRTVDVNITRLRKKIGKFAANIVTRQGFGYCFE